MKFTLYIDKTKDEEVVVTAHERTPFIQELETMVTRHTDTPLLPAYSGEDMLLLTFGEIECITVRDGKTYAVDIKGQQHRLKQRIYELEAMAPARFIRINKSALANETRLERFAATYAGAVNAVFKSGYTEYVSRRCFAEIKRRYQVK